MSALNDLAEQVLKFVTVYREQHGDLVARCFRLENLANSEMEARDRISRHADRLEQRLEKMERFIDGSSMGCAEMSQRIEKMEKALSEEMAKTREMDDILAGAVRDAERLKHYSPVKWSETKVRDDGSIVPPSPGVAHVAGEGQFRSVPYSIAIDPKASPSRIPFSVAIEYLKAGRKLTHPSFEEGNSIQMGTPNHILMHWPDEGKWTNFVMDSALALSDAWTVLTEKPQNP